MVCNIHRNNQQTSTRVGSPTENHIVSPEEHINRHAAALMNSAQNGGSACILNELKSDVGSVNDLWFWETNNPLKVMVVHLARPLGGHCMAQA